MLIHLRRFTALSLLALASVGIVAACSSDSDGSPPGAGTSAPTTTSISAAEGGTVSDAAGTATLTIPPGALAEDTDISLAVSPPTAQTISHVYDFGPDGLTFLLPATLDVKVDAAAIGDKHVALAIEQGGSYVKLAGSSYADGIVSAKVEHFSNFAVVPVETGVGPNVACKDAFTSFQACGGDLKGTWAMADSCIVPDPLASDGPCPSSATSYLYEGSGYTFGADGNFIALAGTIKFLQTHTYAPECTNDNDCAPSMSQAECSTAEGECICVITYESSYEERNGTYSTAGSKLIMQETFRDEKEYEYCVQGDVAYLREPTDQIDVWGLTVLHRQ